MAALDAAALDNGPPGASPHAGAKAVLALTASYVRLISAFHNRESRSGEFAVGARLRTPERHCQRGIPRIAVPYATESGTREK